MKGISKSLLLIPLAGLLLLSGCSNDSATSTKETDESNESVQTSSELDLNKWFTENENLWRTVNNGSWSNDPKDAPSDEDLEKIFDIAMKGQTAVNWNEYFYIAVRDPKEQATIIGDYWGEGCTTDGTVTVLILADQIADQADHKDQYKDYYMQTSFALFDTGYSNGLLSMGAWSLGYQTHYFGTLDGSAVAPKGESTYAYGVPKYDVSKFLEGKNYKRGWGFPEEKTEFDVEGNAVLVGAVVIGKADPSIDVETSATQHGRPDNWAIWDPQE
ncbi:nitroreductase family protein [Bacillus tuaregi]|uniref:nitroreductase family protein n=1 Tax=Bacillus tuaregi TaxID=1816695 RepID=UPI0008F83441|nr:hypothetical protein [Bacillus tuaregi]